MGHISYARGYGVSNVFVLQDDTAFDKTYGEGAFKTLWNNCEIKLALPGQTGTSMLSLLEETLGRESYVAENRSGTAYQAGDWFSNTGFAEDGKAVFDRDQIRRSHQGILIIRKNRPILVDVPAYAAIDPIRDHAGINPQHGTAFVRPTEVWLKSSPNWPIKRISLMIKRAYKRIAFAHARIDPAIRKRRLNRRAKLMRLLSFACRFWWVWMLIYLYLETTFLHRIVAGLAGGL